MEQDLHLTIQRYLALFDAKHQLPRNADRCSMRRGEQNWQDPGDPSLNLVRRSSIRGKKDEDLGEVEDIIFGNSVVPICEPVKDGDSNDSHGRSFQYGAQTFNGNIPADHRTKQGLR